MPYIGLPSFLRYPSKTNDFSACSNPKFAHVFELSPFFLFFRLIFGFFEFFSKFSPNHSPKPISVLYLTFRPYARKNFQPFIYKPFEICSAPIAETLFLLVLSMLVMESADSIRSLAFFVRHYRDIPECFLLCLFLCSRMAEPEDRLPVCTPWIPHVAENETQTESCLFQDPSGHA